MFTGVVSAVGRVAQKPGTAGRLAVSHPETAAHLAVGGSVAVNGCCLTVTELEGHAFIADVVPETLRRTNLGRLQPGDPVNLELPLRLDHGLDGHLVQGHVDATARVNRVAIAGSGRELAISLPEGIAPYVAEKGSIAVDGVSLTVVAAGHREFTVALIPHTLGHTIAGGYTPGSLVNLEADLVARYVRRLASVGTVTRRRT